MWRVEPHLQRLCCIACRLQDVPAPAPAGCRGDRLLSAGHAAGSRDHRSQGVQQRLRVGCWTVCSTQPSSEYTRAPRQTVADAHPCLWEGHVCMLAVHATPVTYTFRSCVLPFSRLP